MNLPANLALGVAIARFRGRLRGMNFFTRQSAAFRNDLSRSLGALVGIAQGLVCDGALNDQEVLFLRDWLEANESMAMTWPGDVVHARVRAALADGVITAEERAYLLQTLQQLVGGDMEDLAQAEHVTDLLGEPVSEVVFSGHRFVLTGNFIFGPRATCERAIELRGGRVAANVSKKVAYVVIGSLGSAEWKHGSFGTKVEDAMALQRAGHKLHVVKEDCWANALSRAQVIEGQP